MSFESDNYNIDEDDEMNFASKELLNDTLDEIQFDSVDEIDENKFDELLEKKLENNEEDEEDQFDIIPVVDMNAPVTGSYRNSVMLTNFQNIIEEQTQIKEEEKKYFLKK